MSFGRNSSFGLQVRVIRQQYIHINRAFSLRKWDEREKALVSAGRFLFLIGWLQCYNYFHFYTNVVKLNLILKMGGSKEATPTEIFPRNPV